MYKNISDLIHTYRLELVAYLIWFEKTVKEHGGNNNHMGWGSHDYEKVNRWNAELRGMEKLLGLSEPKIKTLLKEAEAIIVDLKKQEVTK